MLEKGFVELGLFLLLVLIGMTGLTQIIVPILTQGPLFPSFRKGRKALEHELVAAHYEAENSALKQEIERLKAKNEEKKSEQ